MKSQFLWCVDKLILAVLAIPMLLLILAIWLVIHLLPRSDSNHSVHSV